MPTKRKRRKKRPIPISDIPVAEILKPKINVYGHEPVIHRLNDDTTLAGCSCGWGFLRRTNDPLRSWWKHAREISNGNLLMNGEHDVASSG